MTDLDKLRRTERRAMTDDRWDKLDALAAAAVEESQGNWRYRASEFGRTYGYVEWGLKEQGYGSGTLSTSMARFIAACDPATIRDLVAARERDELRAAAEVIVSQAEPDDDFDGQFISYVVPFEDIDRLRAALNRKDGAS